MKYSKTQTQNTQISKREFLTIKDIGLVNNEFAVILQDGSWLNNVTSVKITEKAGQIGKAVIEVFLPNA